MECLVELEGVGQAEGEEEVTEGNCLSRFWMSGGIPGGETGDGGMGREEGGG